MQKFDTTTPVTTVLNIPAGRIQLIAADRTDTIVDIRPTDSTKNRDVKAAEQINVTFVDGLLQVEAAPAANRILGHSGSVEVTIQLPAGSRIDAKAAAAELRGVGRLGDVTFEGAAGTVKLDETATAHLTLQAGDIHLGRLGGNAELTTQKGDITITEALGGNVSLSTQAGNLTIGAARGVSATLDAGTSYGRVHNALQNSAGAGATLTIHATTAYGDITARSL
jgi:hypothetical protein